VEPLKTNFTKVLVFSFDYGDTFHHRHTPTTPLFEKASSSRIYDGGVVVIGDDLTASLQHEKLYADLTIISFSST
jgi:hypothetical protein